MSDQAMEIHVLPRRVLEELGLSPDPDDPDQQELQVGLCVLHGTIVEYPEGDLNVGVIVTPDHARRLARALIDCATEAESGRHDDGNP